MYKKVLSVITSLTPVAVLLLICPWLAMKEKTISIGLMGLTLLASLTGQTGESQSRGLGPIGATPVTTPSPMESTPVTTPSPRFLTQEYRIDMDTKKKDDTKISNEPPFGLEDKYLTDLGVQETWSRLSDGSRKIYTDFMKSIWTVEDK